MTEDQKECGHFHLIYEGDIRLGWGRCTLCNKIVRLSESFANLSTEMRKVLEEMQEFHEKLTE